MKDRQDYLKKARIGDYKKRAKVMDLRQGGLSWADIGTRIGSTREAARKLFRKEKARLIEAKEWSKVRGLFPKGDRC